MYCFIFLILSMDKCLETSYKIFQKILNLQSFAKFKKYNKDSTAHAMRISKATEIFVIVKVDLITFQMSALVRYCLLQFIKVILSLLRVSSLENKKSNLKENSSFFCGNLELSLKQN